MQIQRRSSSCTAKIVTLIAMVLAVFALIAAAIYISQYGFSLPFRLPASTWCAIAVFTIIVIAVIGLGINAKHRENNP